ncbi:MAG: enoyl-ACP reductase [Anaerolineae bacterium]
MGLLDGKNALIFGLANKHSIAWGITQVFHEQVARIGVSYAIPELEKRVVPLAEEVNADLIEMADVTDDDAIDHVFERAEEVFGTIDILVHSVAFAGRDELSGRYVDTSRDGFNRSLEISVYSLVALARRAEKLMPEGGAILTMTYYGSVAVMPHYNVMGVAKAALESSVRYLAYDLGEKNIRVNAVSAGPIKTLSASGVSGFRKLLNKHGEVAPLGKLVSQEDVGRAAAWLCSDWAGSVTGEILYVDAGYNILGMTVPREELS